MALETLKNYEQINGEKIIRITKDSTTEWPNEYTNSLKTFINIDDENNIISFKIQNGPIKENGRNGCQVDEIVAAALLIIKGLNEKFPCDENVKVLQSLYTAQLWLWQRKHNREDRWVEGTSEK